MPVGAEAVAIQCDFCEEWEHLKCIREPDRPSERMYVGMAVCLVKCIMYYCSHCQSKGSITKCLVKLELGHSNW